MASARPNVERVRALASGVPRDPEERGRRRQELEQLLAGFRERAHGLDPLEPELALASVLGLAALLPGSAGELSELLLALEEPLAFFEPEELPPELALALLQGWSAHLQLDTHALTPAELCARLSVALRHADSVPLRDGRESLACFLADERAQARRTLDEDGPWLEELLAELARFPGDLEVRPYVLVTAADQLRTRGNLGEAWQRLREAEGALTALGIASRRADLPQLERRLAGARFQLELACGMVDEARASLERERAAVAAGASDARSRMDVLWNVASVAMAADSPALKRRYLAQVEQGLADEALAAALPEPMAALNARRAIACLLLEEVELPAERVAPALLAAALEVPALDEFHRQALLFLSIGVAHEQGDLARARALLARMEALDAERPFLRENRWYLAAWRARLALASGTLDEAQERALQAAFDEFRRAFAELPEQEGGIGFLIARSRQLLLATQLEVRLAREGASDAGLRRAFASVLDLESIGSLARRLGAREAELDALLAPLLPPESGLLVYVPAPGATHLFWHDARGSGHALIPWRHEREPDRLLLERRLASSPELLAPAARARELAELEAALARLSARLLPPEVRARLAAWKGLYVVGGGLLGEVPFESLSAGPRPLGMSHALAQLPSLTVGAALARRARPPAPLTEGALLLVAAPIPAEPLRASRPELVPFGFDATRVSTPFPASTVLAGAGATIARLEQELARGVARVLTFVAHGDFDPTRELGAGLVLTADARDPDGILWGDDVLRSARAMPELVLLTACHSARGRRRAGEDGLWQLGGALLAAGSQCTVQASGPIALEPGLRLLEVFGAELADGASPAEALRRARVALAEHEAYRHPFYTQALRVVGLGLAPLFPPRR